jgi:signal peptidase I
VTALDPSYARSLAGRAADEEAEHERARSLVEWVAILAGALIIALLVKTFLFQAFYIPSGSMEPTLHHSDRVIVNKLSYQFGEVERGDVVVFERPERAVGDPAMHDFIKRVIGLPGDQIETHRGIVYVNGRRLDEPYLVEGVLTEDLPPTRVPRGHLWVMGDNRPFSSDSRSFGPIPEDTVIGRAIVRVWPISAISRL